MTLASNVGHEAEENTIGTISKAEAREALRKHKGNIWASVTECVEGRQQKVRQIITRYYRSGLDDICFYSFFEKHCENRKTLPREHLIGCQGVQMLLLKATFKVFSSSHKSRFVIIQVLSQFEFLSFVTI